jgi:hypothetical protein
MSPVPSFSVRKSVIEENCKTVKQIAASLTGSIKTSDSQKINEYPPLLTVSSPIPWAQDYPHVAFSHGRNRQPEDDSTRHRGRPGPLDMVIDKRSRRDIWRLGGERDDRTGRVRGARARPLGGRDEPTNGYRRSCCRRVLRGERAPSRGRRGLPRVGTRTPRQFLPLPPNPAPYAVRSLLLRPLT